MQKHSISAVALTLSVLALFTHTIDKVSAQVAPPSSTSIPTDTKQTGQAKVDGVSAGQNSGTPSNQSGTAPKTSNAQGASVKSSAVKGVSQTAQSKTNIQLGQSDAANQPPFTNNNYVLTGSFPTNGYHKGVPVVVIVDKSSHFTHVLQLQGDRIVRILTISNNIGSLDTPSPPGRYTVVKTKMYPKWIPPKDIDPKQKPVPPYNETHKNPLGVAAIYLNKFEIDLHGTNQPKLIRKSTSHGCVRHSNSDILKLFAVVNKGNVVYIVDHFRGKVLVRTNFVRPTKTNTNSKNEHITHRK